MQCKWIFRRDGSVLRIVRLMWTRGTVGDGKGYSSKFTIGLCPRLLWYRRECDGWLLWLLGVRLHYRWSYGGIFV